MEHGELDDIARRPLDWHIDGFAFGAVADVAVAVVDARQGTDATVDRADTPKLARLFRHFLHEAMHAFVGLVIIVNHFLRFLARDADALRETERFYRVGDSEV